MSLWRSLVFASVPSLHKSAFEGPKKEQGRRFLGEHIQIYTENDVMRVWFLRVFVICGVLCFFENVSCFEERV